MLNMLLSISLCESIAEAGHSPPMGTASAADEKCQPNFFRVTSQYLATLRFEFRCWNLGWFLDFLYVYRRIQSSYNSRGGDEAYLHSMEGQTTTIRDDNKFSRGNPHDRKWCKRGRGWDSHNLISNLQISIIKIAEFLYKVGFSKLSRVRFAVMALWEKNQGDAFLGSLASPHFLPSVEKREVWELNLVNQWNPRWSSMRSWNRLGEVPLDLPFLSTTNWRRRSRSYTFLATTGRIYTKFLWVLIEFFEYSQGW